eukprot:scaffold208362_cov24-Tisochrysis_lutea.AAC.4
MSTTSGAAFPPRRGCAARRRLTPSPPRGSRHVTFLFENMTAVDIDANATLSTCAREARPPGACIGCPRAPAVHLVDPTLLG